MGSELICLLVKALITGALALALWLDLRTQTVPNGLTLPLMAAGLIWQFSQRGLGALWVLAIWWGILLGWTLHFYGGGDAKLLMALFAFWPDVRFFWALCGAAVLVGGMALCIRYRGRLRELGSFYLSNLLAFKLHPAEGEETRGGRGPHLTIAAVLAGGVYAWLLW